MTSLTAEQVLRKAANHLRRHGWVRGAYEDALGRCCIAGAIRLVSDYGTVERVMAHAALRTVTGLVLASDFNDDHCKSADDAIAALEIAADLAA